MKRLLFSFVLLLSAIGSRASDDFVIDGIHYSDVWDGESNYIGVYVTGFDEECTGNIIIPSSIVRENNKSSQIVGVRIRKINSKSANITSIEPPATIADFGIFEGCNNLININVDSDNTQFCSVDGVVFNKEQTEIVAFPPGRSEYTIPNTVTSIGKGAFYGCSKLTSIEIPNTVTNIGYHAFAESAVASFSMSNNIKSFGYGVFASTPWWYAQDTGYIYINNYILYGYKAIGNLEYREFTSASVNQDTKIIGGGAFSDWWSLTSIELPSSVISIGDGAFSRCTSLSSINIPNSVISIGDGAFSRCTSLSSINIPNSVISIGNEAFYGCDLTSIDLPNSIISIGYRAFRNCTSLTEIKIPNSVKNFTARFEGCTSLKKIYLPESATIPVCAFGSAEYISGQTVGPLNLEEISVSRLEKNIGYYFSQNIHLNSNCRQGNTSYKLPENLTLILRDQKELCDYALQDTKDINIILETPIKSIGTDALENSGVTGIALDKDYWTTIKREMFSTCHKLQKLELPFPGPGTANSPESFGALFATKSADGLRGIQQYFENGSYKTYYIPASLTELVLSEGCEIIPYGWLYNCNMLEKVTLPTSLYLVGEKAFYGCAKISDIYCKGADPAVAYDSSFEGMRVSSCKLHIPYNTAELYKRSTGWEKFYYFEEEAPLNISVTKNIENAGVIYGLNEYQPGQTAELKAVAHSGYTFKGWTENGNTLTTDGTYSFVVTDSRSLTAVFAPVLDENDVEVSAGSETAAVSCQEVEGASSYRLDVYSDADMTIPAGSASSAAKAAAMQTRAAAATKTLNVDGLNADTRYYYLLTALSEEGIVLSQFSGSFVTASATGISETANTAAVTVAERYDASGRRIDAPAKGLNILRMSDGTVRKVLVK